MDISQSAQVVSAGITLKEMSVCFDVLASALTARSVTSSRIIRLSEEVGGKFSVAYLAGAWDGHPFRVHFPMPRTGNLRSMVYLGRQLVAFEAELPDSKPSFQMLHAIRALMTLTTEAGNKPEDVYFVSGGSGLGCQFVYDPNQHKAIKLWSPGEVGITNVRMNRHQSLLIGVWTNAQGLGLHLVATSLKDALKMPSRLADMANWERLTQDEKNGFGIVALSRPKTTDTCMQMCATLACANAPREFKAKRVYLQGDLLHPEECGIIQDTTYATACITLGPLPGHQHVWIAYEPIHEQTDGADDVTLRAEIPENPACPFISSL